MTLACTLVPVLLLAVGAAPPPVDALGDPLPPGAVQRLGTLRMKYAGGLTDMQYLPDGRAVVVRGSKLDIWNLAAGKREATHRIDSGAVRSMQVSQDGRRLLLALGDGGVAEWDLAERKTRRRFATGHKQLCWAFYSPDETRVLTTGRTPPELREWDLATGKQRVAIAGDAAVFMKGVYGPEGKTAFVGCGFHTVVAHYDLATGKKLKDFLTNYRTYDLCVSPDGRRLLVGSRSMASEWLIDGYKPLRRFTGHHGGAVNAVAYCAGGEQVLTGSRDGSIRRWDRTKAKVLLRWFPHESYANVIRVSPDGARVLSYGARLLAESDLATGAPRIRWQRHAGAVNGVAFTPDARRVVSASSDGTLRVWDRSTGKTTRLIEGARLGAWALALSPDGAHAAAGCKDSVVRIFDVASGKLAHELKGHRGYVRALAYTPDGRRLVSTADDGAACVWRVDAGKPERRLEGHRGGVLAVAVSPDGVRALTGGRDGTVRVWDLASGRSLRVLEHTRGWVEAVAFTPDGRQAVSTGRDGRVRVWDLATGKQTAEFALAGWARALAVAGSAVYVADGAKVSVWDLATGKKRADLKGHAMAVNALALTADGRHLATGSADTTALLWRTGR